MPAVDYALARLDQVKSTTAFREMEVVARVHEWLKTLEIDLQARVESGEFLNQTEIRALATFLRIRLRTSGVRPLRFGEVIEPSTHRFRLDVACDYLKWLGQRRQGRLPRGTSAAPNHFYIEYDRRLDAMTSCFRDHRPSTWSRNGRTGLNSQQAASLHLVSIPGSPNNPWLPAVQARNHLIVMLMMFAGLRVSEIKGLELHHIGADGLSPLLKIKADPDNPMDRRASPASTKTPNSVRIVPLPRSLYALISTYVREHRPRHVKRRREPFLFLSTWGRELSGQSIYDLVMRLKPATGIHDLSPHRLRHTFVEKGWRRGREMGLDPQRIEDVLRSLVGHSETYPTMARYAKGVIREQAEELTVRLACEFEKLLESKEGSR